jgi:lysophospholipase L1-like esterase
MSPRDPFAVIAEQLAPRRSDELSCYVALGDSFTAGRGCAVSERWSDRLAAALRDVQGELGYRNLAVDGATSTDVLAGQVGHALQLEPDVVTVVCGANDVLHSVRPDLEGYAENLATMLDRLAAGLPRVAVLAATSPERWRFLALGPRTRARVVGGMRRLNELTREVATSRAVPVLDVADHPGFDDPENFLADGIHPSPAGHARAAVEFAWALHRHFGIESAMTRKEYA